MSDTWQYQSNGAPNQIGVKTPEHHAEHPDDKSLSVDWRQYEDELQQLCIVKVEEFQLLGYQDITADEVWQCVRQSFRKEVALHELVSAIVGLKVGQFMNYVTMNAYKGVFGGSTV